MEHEGWSSIIPSLLECPHVIVFEWLDEEIVETVIELKFVVIEPKEKKKLNKIVQKTSFGDIILN